MSLLERSLRAASGPAPNAHDGREFVELRTQVLELLGSTDIAELSRANPAKARNEVRAACRRVFASEKWEQTSEEERARLCDAVLDSMFGLGPLEAMLADEAITEIMVNGADKVFVERDGVLYPSDLRFVDNAQVRVVIDRILGPLGRRIDEASPLVNARLPEGHRVHAAIPPVVPDGPVITIRKFARKVYDLQELQDRGTMPASVRGFLDASVRMRKNIAVSGGTGAGKTTLLNALSCCIPPEERIITIEDSAELRFMAHPNVVRMEARPANAEGTGEITIRELVINALRMRPDRIVVGECRGAEALDMLQAMNTGHDGSLTTLHANSPTEAIARLVTMVRYAGDVPVDVVEANVARAIDIVVQMTRGQDGRRFISEIASMEYDEEIRRPKTIVLYRANEWIAVPSWAKETIDCVQDNESAKIGRSDGELGELRCLAA